MRLPFIRPKSAAGGAADRLERGVDDPGTLQALRTQARRRLIGAGVLLLSAVVGFPLLFETQPRPLPGSVVIDGSGLVLRGEAAGRAANTEAGGGRPTSPSTVPPPRTAPTSEGAAGPVAIAGSAAALAAPPVLKAQSAAAPADTAAAETTEAVKATAAPSAVASQAAAKAPAKAASAVSKTGPLQPSAAPASAPKALVAKPPKAEAAPSAAAAAASTSAGASPGTAADGPAVRWVVQVGAYNDMERMRQARQKAEKLGFKTYITDVDTSTGKRTRVRLGPFATKKEAEAAAAKVKANGMAANVLSV